jgi:hypothetical protein
MSIFIDAVFAFGFWPTRLVVTSRSRLVAGGVAAVGDEPILRFHNVTNPGRLGVRHFWYLRFNCQTTVTFNKNKEQESLDQGNTALL